jgi:1,4-dihydroxy-2-naphthoate octaprenyltransferase
MTKFLNTAKSILKSALDQYFYLIGIIWMFASFLYIGKPNFWVVLGFGIIFTGVQNIINEIKLKKLN